MSNIMDLYAELIIGHNRNPKNVGKPEKFTHTAMGHNTLCGDKITVFLDIQDEILINIMFEGSGCAIFTASSSMMTECLTGKSIQECREIFSQFHDLVTIDVANGNLGKLQAFAGVKEYPARVKCAILPWHAFIAAVDKTNSVSTE